MKDRAKEVNDAMFKSLVSSLMYFTHTRPNIMQSLSIISKYMSPPSILCCAAIKQILRYLNKIRKLEIKYIKESKSSLIELSNSNYVGSLEDRTNISTFFFALDQM